MPICDTHAHLYFPGFRKNLDEVITNCQAVGVTQQIQIGCDEVSSLAALDMAKSYEGMHACLGLHPCDVDQVGIKNPEYHRYAGLENYQMQTHDLPSFFEWLEALFLEHKENVVAFGETGFDLYHRNTPELFQLQTESFRQHIRLAEKYDKTLVIHTRETTSELVDFLETEKPNMRAIVHAFCEGPEVAELMTQKYGYYLGIGGMATYPKMEQVREAIKATPIEFLLTETDAPFLPPHKVRKSGIKQNTPQYLPEVIELIAEIKQLGVDSCRASLWQNAQRCFFGA